MSNYCLEDIFKKYPIVLFDNSSLVGFYEVKRPRFELDIENKISRVIDECNYIKFLYCFVNTSPFCDRFYVTQRVFDELTYKDNFNYKKNIKMMKKTQKLNMKFTALPHFLRKIKERQKQKNKLINILEEKKRIFHIKSDQLLVYNYIYNMYGFFKDDFRLSETDFDLLITGATLSKMVNYSCIVSCDFGLLHSWRNFLNNENLNHNQFGFFINRNINRFEEVRKMSFIY